jgi:hypothetical protein
MLVNIKFKYFLTNQDISIWYDLLTMILANIQQCTLQIYTPVHTANINNIAQKYCTCMYHALLHD